MNERGQYLPYKIKSVTDTPPESVAHSLQTIPVRQCPTPLGPGRNDPFFGALTVDFVQRAFGVMAATPRHTYQVLTKRATRLERLASRLPWPENVWIGVRVENAAQLARIAALRNVPTAVRFVSAEPLLGPLAEVDLSGLDWLIAGGAAGPHARPLQAEGVRDLRGACKKPGVAFFFQQGGGRPPKTGRPTLR